MGYILVDLEDKCFCNCATKCALDNRCGSAARCTKAELEEAGYKTVTIAGRRSQRKMWSNRPETIKVKLNS